MLILIPVSGGTLFVLFLLWFLDLHRAARMEDKLQQQRERQNKLWRERSVDNRVYEAPLSEQRFSDLLDASRNWRRR
jgi:hypothetical protein